MRNEYSECNRVGRLKAPTAYHPMSRLSDNLTARRKQLGLTVPQVHAALQLMGVDVAKPTVYGWLNGNRGFQNMDHLEAVCKVLQTDITSIRRGDIEIAEEPKDVQLYRDIKKLDDEKREIVHALIRSLKPK